jgi:hypothetical protein
MIRRRATWRAARARLSHEIQSEIARLRDERTLPLVGKVNVSIEGLEGEESEMYDGSDCVVSLMLAQGAEEKLPPQEIEDEILGQLLYVSPAWRCIRTGAHYFIFTAPSVIILCLSNSMIG